MSKLVFRNYDKTQLKLLLAEIGGERYQCALKDAGMENDKPMSMEGFYVEFEPDTLDFKLYYRYPSRTTFLIMSVLGYWRIPQTNWERHRIVE